MNKLNSMTSVAALLALSVAGATQMAVAATNTTTEVHATKAADGKCGEAKCGANKMKKNMKNLLKQNVEQLKQQMVNAVQLKKSSGRQVRCR